MQSLPPALTVFGDRLKALGWVSDLWVAGSLATGDYIPGVSDLDLVAVVDRPITEQRTRALTGVHNDLDHGAAAGADLGCVYVEAAAIDDRDRSHPTWTHGELVRRPLSRIARAELGLHGFEVFGRAPADVLAPMTPDDVRAAARSEICGYWAMAARRPWWWLNPVIADLGLTGMARGRHALRTGQLLTKTDAINDAHAPPWLVDQLRRRRHGEAATSPRLRTAWIAWRDTWTTVRWARDQDGPGAQV